MGSWRTACPTSDGSTALGQALAQAVDKLAFVDFVLNFVPGADLLGYMIFAMDLLATFWEYLRNDDLILTRGFALDRSDVKALYYTEGRRMTLGFNARSTGMGHFSLRSATVTAQPPDRRDAKPPELSGEIAGLPALVPSVLFLAPAGPDATSAVALSGGGLVDDRQHPRRSHTGAQGRSLSTSMAHPGAQAGMPCPHRSGRVGGSLGCGGSGVR
ncbi:hypothetical protein ADK75_27375 [Streptomyces virginiae]|uniref:Uncharacterized protein n=1 Tax=Streptomyces virginiae TaxID=1961 RepID=A0A0L8M778_STRVG|nr:hypothetical protein [Streptomyces virginiae]KOG46302.1 hypothetical protein ADK75_27375 [Streptomyces virginiae]